MAHLPGRRLKVEKLRDRTGQMVRVRQQEELFWHLTIVRSHLPRSMLQIQFPAAVLSARLIFFQPQNGGEEGVVWQKEYEQRVGLKARTAAALVAGWNEGLRRLVSKAVEDYR